MKDTLYFHFTEKKLQAVGILGGAPHSYCVKLCPDGKSIALGYAIVSMRLNPATGCKDQFCRANGRHLAEARAVAARDHAMTADYYNALYTTPSVIDDTLSYVLHRVHKIWNLPMEFTVGMITGGRLGRLEYSAQLGEVCRESVTH